MKTSVDFTSFLSAFRACGRETQFTRTGLCALYDYLEELEQDLGEELELDVIALCCDYSEYDSLEEFQRDYGTEYESMADIEQDTAVIAVQDSGSFIIQSF